MPMFSSRKIEKYIYLIFFLIFCPKSFADINHYHCHLLPKYQADLFGTDGIEHYYDENKFAARIIIDWDKQRLYWGSKKNVWKNFRSFEPKSKPKKDHRWSTDAKKTSDETRWITFRILEEYLAIQITVRKTYEHWGTTERFYYNCPYDEANVLNKVSFKEAIEIRKTIRDQKYKRKIPDTIEVTDGDTIKINGERIRFAGIDAPERNQICKKDNEEISCGTFAKNLLIKKIGNKKPICIREGKDVYKRTLAECFIGDESLSKFMVRSGYAFAFRKYKASEKFIDDEEYAKYKKLGMWAMEFEYPWDLR